MKTIVFLGMATAFAVSASAQSGTHSVDGYIKRDGTYVQPHQSTNPNSTKTDNWSSKGNTNPYTGKEGAKDPYAVPAYPAPRPMPKGKF